MVPGTNPAKVGFCLFCGLKIHRGIRGWIFVAADDFTDRLLCASAPELIHCPIDDFDAVRGLTAISLDLKPEQKISFFDPERSICGKCDREIAWLDQTWSDLFFHGELLMGQVQGSGIFCDDRSPHEPSLSWMTDHLKQLCENLA